jgi:hypothetical protein
MPAVRVALLDLDTARQGQVMFHEDIEKAKAFLRKTAIEAGDEKCVNYGGRGLKLLIVWDAFGKCRAYSTETDNTHWSVPVLNNVDTNCSLPV